MAAAPLSSTGPCVGVCVHVIRVRPDGPELLFLRRSGGRFEGQWWPVTGTLEAGEDPAACALRELAEETGLGPEAFYATQHRAPVENDRGHLRIFVALVDEGAGIRINWEHDAHRWHSREEALALVPEIAHPIVREALHLAETRPAAGKIDISRGE